MKVTLRKRAIKNNRLTLYLDIYDGVSNRRLEYLRMYLFKKPKDDLERQHNKQAKELAERIRTSRELQLNEEDHGLKDKSKRKINFLEYWKNYIDNYKKKDIRPVSASFAYFKDFIGNKKTILPSSITPQLCFEFRAYLDQHLSGETPYDYFAKFKKLLKQATREDIFLKNPAEEVKNYKPEGIKKDVLSMDEIKALYAARCGNEEVKRAFLFACLTGLRWVDITALTWGQVHKTKEGLQVFVKQAKTDVDIKINLNQSAIKLIGEVGKKSESVFTLPSHTGMLKNLKLWGERAGINKTITFHVARHSFATNLLIHETDLLTVSSLLGHTSLKHVTKYVRVAKQLKEQAVNKLEIDI